VHTYQNHDYNQELWGGSKGEGGEEKRMMGGNDAKIHVSMYESGTRQLTESYRK
jgi:hypothetical protein